MLPTFEGLIYAQQFSVSGTGYLLQPSLNNLRGRFNYPHCIDEEIEARRI